MSRGLYAKEWPQSGMGRKEYFEAIGKAAAEVVGYEGGWPYVVQSMRSGGWVISGEGGVGFVSRSDGWRRVPALSLVVGSIGIDEYILFLEKARQLAKGPVTIRNLPVDIGNELLEACEYLEVERTEELPLDCAPEERYPQVTVQLDRLVERQDQGYLHGVSKLACSRLALPERSVGGDFVECVRRGIRRLRSFRGVVREYRQGDLGSILHCARTNAQWHFERAVAQGHSVRNGWRGFYEPVETVVRRVLYECNGYVVDVGGRVEAFSVWDWISPDLGGVYALGSTPRIVNAMDLLLAVTYSGTKEHGLQRLCLGGSETRTLFWFKKKVGVCRMREVMQLRDSRPW